MAPPEKLLPQFDCTTCLEILWVVLTISEVKPFLAGQLCQVNFQKFSSLTILALLLRNQIGITSRNIGNHISIQPRK